MRCAANFLSGKVRYSPASPYRHEVDITWQDAGNGKAPPKIRSRSRLSSLERQSRSPLYFRGASPENNREGLHVKRVQPRATARRRLLQWFRPIEDAVFEHPDQGAVLQSEYAALVSRIPREPVTLEDFWGAFWDKPLWSGISRKSITPTYEQLRGHPLNWRQIGSGAYSIVKSRRRAHWRSRHYWRATGPKAIEYRRRQRTADIPVPVTVSQAGGHHLTRRIGS